MAGLRTTAAIRPGGSRKAGMRPAGEASHAVMRCVIAVFILAFHDEKAAFSKEAGKMGSGLRSPLDASEPVAIISAFKAVVLEGRVPVDRPRYPHPDLN